MSDSAFELLSIVGLPLLAGLLALASHVPLGEQVLKRGIVFIDLAIAQVAALGVLAASSQGASPSAATVAGTAAALGSAAFVAWLAKRWPDQREPLIGLVYVGSAALAVVWVSADPHGAQKLRALLAGDILWVTWISAGPLALASLLVVLGVRFKPRLLDQDRYFYPLFAVMISLSVPVLGLYLVFAILIAPALGALPLRRAGRSRAGLIAFGSGAVGFVAGLAASFLLDLPSGPTVVLSLAIGAALTRAATTGRLEG